MYGNFKYLPFLFLLMAFLPLVALQEQATTTTIQCQGEHENYTMTAGTCQKGCPGACPGIFCPFPRISCPAPRPGCICDEGYVRQNYEAFTSTPKAQCVLPADCPKVDPK